MERFNEYLHELLKILNDMMSTEGIRMHYNFTVFIRSTYMIFFSQTHGMFLLYLAIFHKIRGRS